MAIHKITPDLVENFTLTTSPPRLIISSSINGMISGSLYVFPRRSSIEKDSFPLTIYSLSGTFNEENVDIIRDNIIRSTDTNKKNVIQSYMHSVNSQSISLKKQQTIEALRFVPPATFNSNTLRKNTVLSNIMPYYRGVFPESHFAFTNYHSLNFMTGTGLPQDAALIYADNNGSYSLSNAWSFDFWINPKYTSDTPTSAFKAGTIFHRSSSYALSLITGSSKDIYGYPNAFKLLLQLSSSAGVNPSTVNTSSVAFPNNFAFTTTDNALERNKWQHVTVRWGTSDYNYGSGSFTIDGETKGTFVIPSSSLPNFVGATCLIVGNFFEGTGSIDFFNTNVGQRDGLDILSNNSGEAPVGYVMNHPLNAEVHELKIYDRYISSTEIEYLDTRGPELDSELMDSTLKFYLPPFYTQESPFRQFVGTHGGIIQTPFFEKDGTTIAPFNVDASFGAYGHYLNLENFTRDFATSKYPRLFHLTASIIVTGSTTPASFNDYLYLSGANIKRNQMILPNDNGNFYPNHTFMIPTALDYESYTSNTIVTRSFTDPKKVLPTQFINDRGMLSPGFVTLRNLLPISLFQNQAPDVENEDLSGSLQQTLNGVSPENLDLEPSSRGRYTMLQRTGDNSSNQIVFFDISNLYYGMNIEPGTVVLRDANTTGSLGKLELTLKDDGNGNIYRANHSGSFPTWSSVGNVYYNEGIILIKHPSLYFFGKDQFELSFKGKQNIHTLTFNLFKRSQMATSSSNPNYLPVSASNYANDTDKKFVWISAVNLHDDNLNVISRTVFAQPIAARSSDRYLVKTKIDF